MVLSDKESCTLNAEYPFECDFVTIKELDKKLFIGENMEGRYLKNCDEFNESILFDRITCEKLHVELLESLAERYETIGEPAKALEILQEEARLDPENEKAVLHIMQLYTETRQWAAAIKYYKQFKSILWDNLKISHDESLSSYYNMLVSTAGESRNEGERPCELMVTVICIPEIDSSKDRKSVV